MRTSAESGGIHDTVIDADLCSPPFFRLRGATSMGQTTSELRQRSRWHPLVTFIGVFVVLEFAFLRDVDGPMQRLLVDWATVAPGGWLISTVFRDDRVRTHGRQLVSSRVRLNVQQGCEGAELYFLMIAAVVATRTRWRARMVALVGGVILVFALNELRILSFYATLRGWSDQFEWVHGYVAPTFLVAALASVYWWWSSRIGQV